MAEHAQFSKALEVLAYFSLQCPELAEKNSKKSTNRWRELKGHTFWRDYCESYWWKRAIFFSLVTPHGTFDLSQSKYRQMRSESKEAAAKKKKKAKQVSNRQADEGNSLKLSPLQTEFFSFLKLSLNESVCIVSWTPDLLYPSVLPWCWRWIVFRDVCGTCWS